MGRKRKSLADTLREQRDPSPELEKAAQKADRVESRDRGGSSRDTADTDPQAPTDSSNTLVQHPSPTPQSNISVQQLASTVEINTRSQQGGVGANTRNQQLDSTPQHTNSTPQSNTLVQHPGETSPENAHIFIKSKKPTLKSRNQKYLYNFFDNYPNILTTYKDLHEITGIAKATLRDILRQFERKGLITKKTSKDEKTGVRGLHIVFQHPSPTPASNTQVQHTNSTPQAYSKIDRIYLSNSGGGSAEGGGSTQVSQSGADNAKAKLLNLSDADIEFFWPNLAKSGFGTSQIQQIVTSLEKKDKPLDHVMRGLEHIEYEAEQDLLRTSGGGKVEDLCSWAYSSLARYGYYRKPKGYITPEEKAERDAQEEQEQIKKARYERALAEFDNWLSDMSEEERQNLNTGRRGPERQWLWSQFKKKQGYEGKI